MSIYSSPCGETVEAYWLTNLPSRSIGRHSLYAMAKSRWRIENQGFSDAKNRYGLEHISDHHPQSLLVVWLLTCLALTLERIYRLRHLHRGTYPPLSAIALLRILLPTLPAPAPNGPPGRLCPPSSHQKFRKGCGERDKGC